MFNASESAINLIKHLVTEDSSEINMNRPANGFENFNDLFGKIAAAPGLTPLAPFMYHKLRNRKLESSVPVDILAKLKNAYYVTIFSNLKKLYATGKVLEALQQASILAIPLKGITLIEFLYQDPGIRPMADVDLLIKPQDFQVIKTVLESVGYLFIDSYRGSYNFIDRENKVSLDLHSQFLRYEAMFNIDYHEIYARLRKVTFNGQVHAKVLCPEHQLIHIAMHLAPGLYTQLNLLNLLDLYSLLSNQQSPFDWEYLVDFARRSKVSSYIYAPLFLYTQLFNMGIPERILHQLGEKISYRKAQYIQNDYLETILNGGILTSKIFLERLIWVDGTANKLKLLRMAFLPDRREIARRYDTSENSFKLYVLYLLRLWQLLRDHSHQKTL